MKVILRQQVQKIGEKNDICDVKDGYARNFLIPNKMAVIATESNIRDLKKIKERAEKPKNISKSKKKLKKKRKK